MPRPYFDAVNGDVYLNPFFGDLWRVEDSHFIKINDGYSIELNEPEGFIKIGHISGIRSYKEPFWNDKKPNESVKWLVRDDGSRHTWLSRPNEQDEQPNEPDKQDLWQHFNNALAHLDLTPADTNSMHWMLKVTLQIRDKDSNDSIKHITQVERLRDTDEHTDPEEVYRIAAQHARRWLKSLNWAAYEAGSILHRSL